MYTDIKVYDLQARVLFGPSHNVRDLKEFHVEWVFFLLFFVCVKYPDIKFNQGEFNLCVFLMKDSRVVHCFHDCFVRHGQLNFMT